jgi:hypothetical protein
MNNAELESKLKCVPVPERPEEYWAEFPSRVRVQLRRERPEFVPRPTWHIRPAWAGSFALAMTLVLVCLQYHPLQAASATVTRHERHLSAQLARLDTGLHRLILNTDGMGYLLGEAN